MVKMGTEYFGLKAAAIVLKIVILIGVGDGVDVKSGVSVDLAHSICGQMAAYGNSGQVQAPVKRRPGQTKGCGWHIFGGCEGGTCGYNGYESCRDGHMTPKIVGGQNATPHAPCLPFRFGLTGNSPTMERQLSQSDTVHVCGATIINKDWVVTAGHCELIPKYFCNYKFVAGDHNRLVDEGTEQVLFPEAIIRHPDYLQPNQTAQNDVALVKLNGSFIFNELVAPVTLPSPDFRVDGLVTAVGWGVLRESSFYNSPILQEVVLPIISDQKYQEIYDNRSLPIIESHVCTLEGGKDGCNGDSGGPLYKTENGQQILAGVTSWGNGCARPDGPGVWTEVAYFVPWIEETIRNYQPRPRDCPN